MEARTFAGRAEKRQDVEDGLQIFASTSPQKRLIQPEEGCGSDCDSASASVKGITG
jgi:hypothetical protein